MVSQLMSLLRMFLPGAVIGGALAWFIMKRWLEDYANSRGIEGWVFVLGPLIILLFALLSISLQTWRSSRQSPAESLRHL
jgi:putative ABC transport system permease protein